MTRPKGKLFALVAIFLAIGLVTATGAFTSVQAQRTVDATVDSDANAIVGLTPYDGPNGNGGSSDTSSDGYAKLENGVLQLNLGGYTAGSPDGYSLNYNATTDFDYVFNVTNNGAQDFDYYVTRDGEAANAENAVVFYQGQAGTGNNVTGTPTNARTLTTGSTETISIRVDLTGVDSSDVPAGTSLVDGITVHATA